MFDSSFVVVLAVVGMEKDVDTFIHNKLYQTTPSASAHSSNRTRLRTTLLDLVYKAVPTPTDQISLSRLCLFQIKVLIFFYYNVTLLEEKIASLNQIG